MLQYGMDYPCVHAVILVLRMLDYLHSERRQTVQRIRMPSIQQRRDGIHTPVVVHSGGHQEIRRQLLRLGRNVSQNMFGCRP